MPGIVRGAIALGTLPFSLSTKFTESHAVQASINEYHDGSSQRTSLVVGGRRTWKLSKRLTAYQLGTLRDFWESLKNGAFYFYNPSETLPPFSHAPMGTSGRYLVRFANDWEQSNGMARSDTGVELVELASDLDISDASSVTNASVPTSAVMYAVTAHYPNPDFSPGIGASFSLSPVSLFSPADWLESPAQWTKRTDTKRLDYQSWNGSVLFGLDTILGGSDNLSPRDELWVYDCWMDLTYGDGSVVTKRPTVAEDIVRPNGGVDSSSLAIDGSADTYAVVWRTQYTYLGIGTFLALRRFR